MAEKKNEKPAPKKADEKKPVEQKAGAKKTVEKTVEKARAPVQKKPATDTANEKKAPARPKGAMTAKEVAEKAGMSVVTFRRILHAQGIDTPKGSSAQRLFTKDEANAILAKVDRTWWEGRKLSLSKI